MTSTKVKRQKRNKLYVAQRGKCHYCNRATDMGAGNLDHKIPRALGGTEAWENIVFSCVKCNTAKGAMTHEAFTKTLLTEAIRILSSPAVQQYVKKQRQYGEKCTIVAMKHVMNACSKSGVNLSKKKKCHANKIADGESK